ncbi:hypothetical protein SAMN05192533_112102 [Mesobacillus persicus]|uniref:Uncharacterized protein n=1 Tax=Mesobacillus persicus TaxID=930146 RepID=A0A1H8G753_9BACI|nr:hypothetical protein SAMN05192533_112102 [Mesobacillus persicus]
MIYANYLGKKRNKFQCNYYTKILVSKYLNNLEIMFDK